MSAPLSARAQMEKSAITINVESRVPKGAVDFGGFAGSPNSLFFTPQLTAAAKAGVHIEPISAAVNRCATQNRLAQLPAGPVSALKTGANLGHIFPELSISRIAPYN